MNITIEAYKKDVDRTLLRENLRLTPAQRFERFDQFMLGIMELHRAGQKHRINQRRQQQDSINQGNDPNSQ